MKDSLLSIPGVGEKTLAALTRLNIFTENDLLFHFPENVRQRNVFPSIFSLSNSALVILKVKIIDIDQPNNPFLTKKKNFKIYCGNETGRIQLVYFNYYPQYLLKWAKIGSEIIIIGKIEIFNGLKQISHPEVLEESKFKKNIWEKEIIYPLTYGLINKQIQKYIAISLEKFPKFEEWIDPEIIQKFSWDSLITTFSKIHNPDSSESISPYSKERQRLAYDELLATQLIVNLLRNYKNQHQGRVIPFSQGLVNQFIASLDFKLTQGQLAAIAEISAEQNSSIKMSRLLQGDVGSGKTIVAIAAMLLVAESGAQAVIMAPTDVLANQHFITLGKLLKGINVEFAILTGKSKTKQRRQVLNELENGKIKILIGTHAVFQEKVKFHDLALVVIDEQHRFGVEQRLMLLGKGNNPDLLVMSATPIPRSLSLALYGDMDVSIISEKPANRIPIKTSLISKAKLPEVIQSLQKIINQSGKIYWICPLVSADEKEQLNQNSKISTEERALELSKFYPGLVAVVHGQMEANKKQENLDKFITGDAKILVATTVIEVGIDVPDATVIIIENAESFGLSQLHQLRGRVGRGDKASNCVLIYSYPVSQHSMERLKILKNNDDGFVLAEEDLKLRGSGDLVGTKQSGLPNFRVVDFIIHYNLIALANCQAKNILKTDPHLKNKANQKYHHLLELFGFNIEQKLSILN